MDSIETRSTLMADVFWYLFNVKVIELGTVKLLSQVIKLLKNTETNQLMLVELKGMVLQYGM
jgi:DNA-binding ferritin-like protein (Dps family)